MAQLYSKARDFTLLLRNLESFTAGQARIVDYDETGLERIDVELRPSDGPYKGGTFMFRMILNDDFPNVPPEVTSLTPIYHPNIDVTSGEVCLSLWGEWQARFGLQDVIQGLLFLLYEPNLDDMLVDYITPETFTANVNVAMDGKIDDVDGFDLSNDACVDTYFVDMAVKKGVSRESATSLRDTVPSRDTFYHRVDHLLDQERLCYSLELVDNPVGPLYHAHYHSRQKQALTKSTTFHGLLYHPGLQPGSPMTSCGPVDSPAARVSALQRAQTVMYQGGAGC